MADRSDLGVQFDLAGPTSGGAGLTQDVYVAQAAHVFHVGAAGDLAIWVEATADNATALSAIAFKLQTSYDGTSWADVATDKADGSSSAQVDQAFAVTAGATTRGWLLTQRHRLSNHARLLAKGTGGATKAGDRARATVKAA
jgi:hypothetical protein